MTNTKEPIVWRPLENGEIIDYKTQIKQKNQWRTVTASLIGLVKTPGSLATFRTHSQDVIKPKVSIQVDGGVAEIVVHPAWVEVEIDDLDDKRADAEEVERRKNLQTIIPACPDCGKPMHRLMKSWKCFSIHPRDPLTEEQIKAAHESETPDCEVCGHNQDMVFNKERNSWACHQTHRIDDLTPEEQEQLKP